MDWIENANDTYTTRGKVTGQPPPVSITLGVQREHGLVGVSEGEVQGLGWEVTEHVCRVTTPQREHTLVSCCASEALDDTIVLAVETASLQHLILCVACWLVKLAEGFACDKVLALG